MNRELFFNLVSQLGAYSIVTWLVFIALAFFVARYLPWWCIPLGHLLVVVILFYLDVRWIQAEMNKPDWNGTPDMDLIFDIGVLVRAFLINTLLLPVSWWGFWLRRRHRSPPQAKPTA